MSTESDVSTELAQRIQTVRDVIAQAARRAKRQPEEITLVAVSKTVSAEQIAAAAHLGITTFGENRVQEAEEKQALLARYVDLPRLDWHLVGHLQSNKARRAVELFSMIESLDSVPLANQLDRLARERDRTVEVLVEVNVGGEATKFGFAPADLAAAFRRIADLPRLRVRGLMTVAPLVPDPELARPFFRALRALRDRLVAENPGVELPELSMGMTGDYPVAIEEGATIVRIGRAIFGERPT